MRGKTTWILTVALAASAFAAGCGDDTDPKEEYIADGDEICARGTFKIGRTAQDRYGNPAPPPEQTATFAREIIVPTLQQKVVDKLRELDPPEGDEQQVEAIYEELERGIGRLEENPDLINEPNTGGAFNEANRLAVDYGFKQCGSG
jgi:hypothetical protein